MYQELGSGLLLRIQKQERERYVKKIHRMRELEGGNSSGPGWRSPASVARRGPDAARTCRRGPLLLPLRWVRGMQPAGAKV